MSDRTPPDFEKLIDLLVLGNEPAVGYSGLYVDGQRRWRVWRLGVMARIEEAGSGRLHFTAGPRHFWRTGTPLEADLYAARDGRHVPPELELLMFDDPEPYWRGWLARDVALVERTMQPVTFADRAAWRFSAPRVKGGSPSITVDAELGLITQSASEDGANGFAWSDLRVESDLIDSFFEPSQTTVPGPSWPPRAN